MAKCVDAELLAVTYMEEAKEMGVEELKFLTPEDVARTILHCADSCEEIAPVIHAHWINVNQVRNECSNCHDGQFGINSKTFYCPFCGAKMDEVAG